MKCPNCGFKVRENARYCDNCAEIFDQVEVEVDSTDIEKEQLERFERENDYEPLPTSKYDKGNKDFSDQTPESFLANRDLNGKLKSYLGDLEYDKNIFTILGLGVVAIIFLSYMIDVVNITLASVPAIIIIMIILNSEKEVDRQLVKLYDMGRYEEARERLKDAFLKRTDYNLLKQIILIDWVVFGNAKEVKKGLKKLPEAYYSDPNISETIDSIDDLGEVVHA